MKRNKNEHEPMPSFSESLFQSLDGVFAVDAKQRIIFWNTACEQLFGISSKVAIGRPCSEVVRGKDSLGDTFCRGGCCVARLTEGYHAPRTFPLQISDIHGEQLNLSVSILLVPSRQKDMWTCVHLLHRGEVPDILEDLEQPAPQSKRDRAAKNEDRDHRPNRLTAREQEIVELLAHGFATPVISKLLNISLVTVRNHMQHIQAKLGVHSQAETVAYAYRNNLV